MNIRCPFCSAVQEVDAGLATGHHRLICNACRRMYLLNVKYCLGIWKTYQVYII